MSYDFAHNLKSLVATMGKPYDQVLMTHPNNEYILRQVAETRDWAGFRFDVLTISDMEVQFSEVMPERQIEYKWHPPKASRFVDYGPEDEWWMRPAGLGWIERIDKGPLFVLVKKPMEFRFSMSGLSMFARQQSKVVNCTV